MNSERRINVHDEFAELKREFDAYPSSEHSDLTRSMMRRVEEELLKLPLKRALPYTKREAGGTGGYVSMTTRVSASGKSAVVCGPTRPPVEPTYSQHVGKGGFAYEEEEEEEESAFVRELTHYRSIMDQAVGIQQKAADRILQIVTEMSRHNP